MPLSLSQLRAIHARSPATLFSAEEAYRMTSGFEDQVAALEAVRADDQAKSGERAKQALADKAAARRAQAQRVA